MREMFIRYIQNIVGRESGPLHFRIILQPLMAIVLATRDGLRDAREGKPAYFWSVFTIPSQRAELLESGWKTISRVFILAVILDLAYQVIVYRWFYPFETVLVAVVLALVPYLCFRGPVNRLRRL